MYVANFEATNKADWVTLISAVDADTGEDIDFTNASVKASRWLRTADRNGR